MSPVAIVTGAARGIGAATVRTLASQGWSVLAVDRCADDPNLGYRLGSRAELEAVADSAGPDVVAAVADVRDADALGAAVAEAEARWGGLDAAVAVAGVIVGGVNGWELPVAQERAVLEVNLLGVMHLAHAAVPALLRRPEPRRGRFLAVASAAATHGFPKLAAYGASKAGVTGFVRALAVELSGTGVTANAVSPGSTDTAILEECAQLYRLGDRQEFAKQQTVRRLLEPAEIAEVLGFLASEHGAAVTGVDFPVDGGLAN